MKNSTKISEKEEIAECKKMKEYIYEEINELAMDDSERSIYLEKELLEEMMYKWRDKIIFPTAGKTIILFYIDANKNEYEYRIVPISSMLFEEPTDFLISEIKVNEEDIGYNPKNEGRIVLSVKNNMMSEILYPSNRK